MSAAHYRTEEAVAVITLDNPPVNGLGHAVRQAVIHGLQQAQADEAVRVIMIAGANQVFSGGADIREFHTPRAREAPTLLEVIAAVESSPRPVIAAIGGVCMGGMVYLTGYGFPRHRGGPMLHADLLGLPAVVEKLERFAVAGSGDAGFWKPAPLLAGTAAEGRGFNG